MANEHDVCPCAAVEELKKMVEKQSERLDEHQKRLYDGNTTFELLRRDIATLNVSLAEQTRKLSELLEKPSKRWESIVAQIISLIVVAGFSYFLGKG